MLNLIIPSSYKKEINQSRLGAAYRASLSAFDLEVNTTVTLRITNNRTIREFNRAWRNENSVTDVLSFENSFIDPETGEKYLGDIIISFEKARQQSRSSGHSLQYEVEMLFVHGLLHLVGYDHDSKEQWQEMTRLQDHIMQKIANPLRGGIQYNAE